MRGLYTKTLPDLHSTTMLEQQVSQLSRCSRTDSAPAQEGCAILELCRRSVRAKTDVAKHGEIYRLGTERYCSLNYQVSGAGYLKTILDCLLGHFM